jgi:hypothetical protein
MDASETRKRLDLIRIVAIVDGLLLVPLLLGLVLDWDIKGVLGPIHGCGYLLLLFLTARGAGERRWGWWFPAVVVVTLGPPGSLYGDLRIRRELQAA